MKSALPEFFPSVIIAANNSKRSLENFFIVLAVIIGILSQVFVFIMDNLADESMPLTTTFSFILWLAVTSSVVLTTIIIRLRKEAIQGTGHHKNRIEKTILQLEAKALRAQMNPHFIFNCMNSLKLLIQQKEEDKVIIYLTAFSKLMRIIFQNSDRKEITLFDEMETCRLYAQLESLRFNNKFNYDFIIDETLDLKSVMVPALIVQPFIENAIWHGIMPKQNGGRLTVKINKHGCTINCIIEDDGIGRKVSMQHKSNGAYLTHESKGMRLAQSRLELNNILHHHNATVEIIDKANDIGEVSGTTVILTFKED